MSASRKAALRRYVLALALHEDSDYEPLRRAFSEVHDQADRKVLLAVYAAVCVLNEAGGGYGRVEIAEADVLLADKSLDDSVDSLRHLVSELPQAYARFAAGATDTAKPVLRGLERFAVEVRFIRKIYGALTADDAAKAARWREIAVAAGARPGAFRPAGAAP